MMCNLNGLTNVTKLGDQTRDCQEHQAAFLNYLQPIYMCAGASKVGCVWTHQRLAVVLNLLKL